MRVDHFIHHCECNSDRSLTKRVELLEAQGEVTMSEFDGIKQDLAETKQAITATNTAIDNIRTDISARVDALQDQIDAVQAAGGISADDAAALKQTSEDVRTAALGVQAKAEQLDSEDAAGA